mmetsp:Transcript_35425/g.100311  ORF Transcript_35425/g.100311 Transcript_35425/m.100311 type:complete len:378 (-) Transcript_35425:8-1141(-)
MVKVWAEKEMRNLARLRNSGIKSPEPLLLRSHVLVMEFIGTDGVAAPRLKDAGLSETKLRSAYEELVRIVRVLYQTCRLVHADLSEYNILWHEGSLWIIDVSQAVDLDHPRSLDFLRADCSHCNDFFRRNGVAVLTNKELFDFAVDPTITNDNIDEVLERLKERASQRPIERTAEEEVKDAVFQQAYIPTRMDEVVHYERDHTRAQAGEDLEDRGVFYQTLMGLKPDMSGPKKQPDILDTSDGQKSQSTGGNDLLSIQTQPAASLTPFSSASKEAASTQLAKPSLSEGGQRGAGTGVPGDRDEGAGEDDEESGDGSGSDGYVSSEDDGLTPDERKQATKEARKAHKKEVKETAREKRKTKLPKHVKKRKEKAGSKKK